MHFILREDQILHKNEQKKKPRIFENVKVCDVVKI